MENVCARIRKEVCLDEEEKQYSKHNRKLRTPSYKKKQESL